MHARTRARTHVHTQTHFSDARTCLHAVINYKGNNTHPPSEMLKDFMLPHYFSLLKCRGARQPAHYAGIHRGIKSICTSGNPALLSLFATRGVNGGLRVRGERELVNARVFAITARSYQANL